MEWSPQKSIEDMDKGGVATTILSISEPNVWFGDDAKARALARASATMCGGAARVRLQGTLRFLCRLPLPDVDGALKEIALRDGHAEGRRRVHDDQPQRQAFPAIPPSRP